MFLFIALPIFCVLCFAGYAAAKRNKSYELIAIGLAMVSLDKIAYFVERMLH